MRLLRAIHPRRLLRVLYLVAFFLLLAIWPVSYLLCFGGTATMYIGDGRLWELTGSIASGQAEVGWLQTERPPEVRNWNFFECFFYIGPRRRMLVEPESLRLLPYLQVGGCRDPLVVTAPMWLLLAAGAIYPCVLWRRRRVRTSAVPCDRDSPEVRRPLLTRCLRLLRRVSLATCLLLLVLWPLSYLCSVGFSCGLSFPDEWMGNVSITHGRLYASFRWVAGCVRMGDFVAVHISPAHPLVFPASWAEGAFYVPYLGVGFSRLPLALTAPAWIVLTLTALYPALSYWRRHSNPPRPFPVGSAKC